MVMWRTVFTSPSNLYPAPLAACDYSNLVGNFREILILAHDNCHIVDTPVSKSDNINRDSHINTLLLSCQKRMLLPVGCGYGLIPVPKGPAIHNNSLPPHRRKLVRPKVVPARGVISARDARVKANLGQLPFLLITDSLCES